MKFGAARNLYNARRVNQAARTPLVIHTELGSHELSVGNVVRFKRSIRRFNVRAGMRGTVLDWCIDTLFVQLLEGDRQLVEVESHFHSDLEFEVASTPAGLPRDTRGEGESPGDKAQDANKVAVVDFAARRRRSANGGFGG